MKPQMIDVAQASSNQAVDTDHRVSIAYKCITEVRTKKPGPTRHKSTHCNPLSLEVVLLAASTNLDKARMTAARRQWKNASPYTALQATQHSTGSDTDSDAKAVGALL